MLARAMDKVVMDCGGKQSATPLSLRASGQVASIYADSSQSGVALRLPPQSISVATPGRILIAAAGPGLVRGSYLSRACLVPLSYQGGPRLRGKGRSPPRTGVRRRCRWLVRPPGYATAFSTRNRLKRLQRCSLARAGSQKDRALGA